MSVRRSLLWAYGSQFVTFTLNFGSSVIVARLLSPHDMGVFAIAMATLGVMSIFTQLNVGTYLVREGALTTELIRAVYSVNALMSVALGLLTFALGLAESFFFGERDVGAVLMLSSLHPLISLWEFVPSALFQREMNYAILSKVGVVRVCLSALVTLACAFRGLGALSLVIGPLFANISGAIYFNIVRRADLVIRPTFTGLRPIVTFGMQIMSISGVAQLAQRVSEIALGRLLGLSALGIYSRASSISNLIFSNVYGQATSVVFAKMSKDLRETGSLHATFTNSLRMITCVMWPIVIGLAVLAGPLIRIIYGEKWLGAALPLSFLMIAQFVTLGFGMNWELFVLRGETARQTRFEALRAAFGTFSFIAGCFFSIAAAAAARIVEATVGYFLYRPHMDRLAGAATRELEHIFAESFVLMAIAVMPAVVIMSIYGWSPYLPPAAVVVSIALGAVGWLAGLIIRRHPIVPEALLILGKLYGLARGSFAVR